MEDQQQDGRKDSTKNIKNKNGENVVAVTVTGTKNRCPSIQV